MAGCAPEEYEVEVQADPEEAGEIKGEGTYEEGEEVTVESHGNSDYIFKGWLKEGEKISDEVEYTFEIEKDKQLIAEYDETIEVINETIVDFQTAYLQANLGEAKEYLESEEILENTQEKEELKDEITPTAVDTIKPTIVDLYLDDINHQVEVIEKDDEITKVKVEWEYLDHEEFEQLFDEKLQEALDKAVVEKTDWEDILADAMEEAPNKSYEVELEFIKKDGTIKLTENPIPQKMYPYELSDSIDLANNYVENKENITNEVETVEYSLSEAGLEDYLPLSDSENHEHFLDDLDGVMRDIEPAGKRGELRSPSIGTINTVEIANQVVELEESIELGIRYGSGDILTSDRDILEEWNYYFDEHVDEERRSLPHFGDRIRQGGRLGKHDSHANLISFTLEWGGCINIFSAMGYIDTEKDEINVANFSHGSVNDPMASAKMSSQEEPSWFPYDNYHVYQISSPGNERGNVYKVTDLNDYSNVEIDQPEIMGNIEKVDWSDDGSKLYFKEIIDGKRDGERLDRHSYSEDDKTWEEELDVKAIEWTLNLKTNDLNIASIKNLEQLVEADNLEELDLRRTEVEDEIISKLEDAGIEVRY